MREKLRKFFKSDIFLNMITLAVAIIISLLICEQFLRYYYSGSETLTQFNSGLDRDKYFIPGLDRRYYEHVPNRSWVWNGVVYRTNSFGLRNKEVSLVPSSNVYRILMLGDSVTYGLFVREDKNFSCLLEKKLNTLSQNKKFEVINGGVTTYNISEYRKFLDRKGKRLLPHLIIVNFVGWDCEEGMLKDETENKTQFFSIHFTSRGAKKIIPFFSESLHQMLVERSYLYTFLSRKIGQILNDFGKDESSKALLLWRGVREVRQIANIAKSIHAKVLLVIHPYYFGNTWQEYENISAWHHELGRKIAIENNMPFLDLLNDFKGSDEIKNVRLDIIHPNEKGNEIIANALLNYLRQMSEGPFM